MLTINPRLNTLTGWELDPYGYAGNEAFPTVQVDIQNPFSSPVLPPSTKTFASQPPASSLSPTCDEPTVEYDLTTIPPVPVSSGAPATSSTPVPSGSSPQPPAPESESSKPERTSRNNHDRKRPPNHIPRPPNAFMIYRSEFVKSPRYDKIKEVEKNQQMISKMIGAIWRRLPEEKKARWRIRAKESEAEHALKYPGYAYKPTKREEIKRRRQQKTEEEKQQHCEELLRTYMPGTIEQPIVESAAPRKRKSRAKKKKTVESEQPVVSSTDSSSASASAALAATFQADSQSAVDDPITSNDLPASAAPVVSETTAVSELYARYNRDKAAGMPTTTEMFNTQYMYPSFFGSQQSQFLPSSQVQVEYSAPSMAPSYFSEDIFQNLVLPPADVAAASPFPPNNANVSATVSQAQAQSAENWGSIAISTVGKESVSMPGSGSFVNIHMGKPVNLPVQMFSQPENQHSDMHLVEPQFISSDDLSQININLDGLDFSTFYNLDGTASADFVQFANNEGAPGFYGFNNGGENLDIGVQTGSVMGQETGFGTLVNGNSVVGIHMKPNLSTDFTTVVPNEVENQHYGATPAESQLPATVDPSEIGISQNDLGIYSFQQLDSTVTVQADSMVNQEPRFYNFDKGSLGATAHVDSVTNQDSGYGSDSVVYMNPPTYFPVVVQPENQHPGVNTNLIDRYGVFDNTNNVGNINVNPPTDFPIIVQAESHHLGVNSLTDQQQMQLISTAPGHHLFEMNVGHGMHCSDPTFSGVLVPDKPPPYLYQGALDVPTNELASGNGHGY